MELNTEEYFLLLFAFNLTLALLLHLSETLPHMHFFCWSFDSVLLPPSSSYLPFLRLSLPFTFPFCSPSLFDYLCFLPIISPISSFSLGHIFFSLHFCLSLIFVPVINHPLHTELANSSYLSFSLLPQLSFWLPCQVHADPRISLCSPHSLSLSCFPHNQFDVFSAGSLSRTHVGASIPAP